MRADFDGEPAHFLRAEAERLFSRPARAARSDDAAPAEGPPEAVTSVSPAAQAPRVLPDLLAQAQAAEEELATVTAPRRRVSTASGRGRRRPIAAAAAAGKPDPIPPAPVAEAAAERMVAQAEAGPRPVRGRLAKSRLPRGERWKERRLPAVCWERTGLRRRG